VSCLEGGARSDGGPDKTGEAGLARRNPASRVERTDGDAELNRQVGCGLPSTPSAIPLPMTTFRGLAPAIQLPTTGFRRPASVVPLPRRRVRVGVGAKRGPQTKDASTTTPRGRLGERTNAHPRGRVPSEAPPESPKKHQNSAHEPRRASPRLGANDRTSPQAIRVERGPERSGCFT
jgi:hypothetical protein